MRGMMNKGEILFGRLASIVAVLGMLTMALVFIVAISAIVYVGGEYVGLWEYGLVQDPNDVGVC